MKECKYCGTKYKDEQDACPNCGGNLIVTAEEIAQAAELAKKEKENQRRSVAESQNQLKRLIGIIAGVVAAIIVIVVCTSYVHDHRAVNGDLSRADMTEAYEQGVTFYDSGDYALAIAELGKVSAESKYYDEAAEILQEAVTAYSADALSKASVYTNSSDYKMACSILENALQVVPTNSTLTAELASYQEAFRNQLRSSTLEAVEDSIAENDYPTAIQTLLVALDELSSDVELNALLEKYKDDYRDIIIAQADKALDNDGYEVAISIAKQGLSILNNDTSLLQAIAKYENYKPVWLSDIDYFDEVGDWTVGHNSKDNIGIEHTHLLYTKYHFSNGNPYRIYKIDGQYTTLKGCLFQMYESRATKITTHLYIYGDNVLIWEGLVSNGVNPVEFDVDITGIYELKIELTQTGFYGSEFTAALGDVSLYF